MKKFSLAATAMCLIFALAACGSTATSSSRTESTASLSLEDQLLVGTLKLEDTSLAVTQDQAAELLPLWEALRSLAGSSIAANQEVEAVINQIEEAMSPGQIDSITAMKLTQSDLAAAVTSLGASTEASTAASTAGSRPVLPAVGGGTGAPSGGDPGGGNPPTDLGAGGALASAGAASAGLTQASATQTVASQSAGSTDAAPAALISALIELLQKKAG